MIPYLNNAKYVYRWMYNPLNKLVRRIKDMLKRRRDILILALAFMLAQLPTYFRYYTDTDWNMPTWNLILEVSIAIIGLGAIIMFLRYLLRKLDAYYTTEEAQQKRRDTMLVKAIKRAFKEALKEYEEEKHKEQIERAGDW